MAKPGESGFVTGTAQDSQGNLYISEDGDVTSVMPMVFLLSGRRRSRCC